MVSIIWGHNLGGRYDRYDRYGRYGGYDALKNACMAHTLARMRGGGLPTYREGPRTVKEIYF